LRLYRLTLNEQIQQGYKDRTRGEGRIARVNRPRQPKLEGPQPLHFFCDSHIP